MRLGSWRRWGRMCRSSARYDIGKQQKYIWFFTLSTKKNLGAERGKGQASLLKYNSNLTQTLPISTDIHFPKFYAKYKVDA